MIIECIAIIVVVLVLCAIFLRRGKQQHAFAALPLIIVPLVHIIANLTAEYLEFWTLSVDEINAMFTAISLVISCVAFGVLSNIFEEKRSRKIYIITCGLYSLILTAILIIR